MLRSHEKGHGSGLPFRPGSAAYRPGTGADADAEREQGSGSGDDRYGLLEIYEYFSAEYGWTPAFIEANLTNEQFALYAEKAGKRRSTQAFVELDRIVTGTNIAVAVWFDHTGKNLRRWQQLRRKLMPSSESKGLSGAALEQAVAGIAVADPSLVRVQGAQ